MAVGGATRATPGTLDLGSGNSFDFSDVTEAGTATPYNHAWWTYTPSGAVRATIDTLASEGADPDTLDTVIVVYRDVSEAAYASNDDAGSGTLLSRVVFDTVEGDTYIILVGTYDPDGDGAATYRLNLAEGEIPPPPPTVTHRSPWSSALRDDPDNWLVISAGQFGVTRSGTGRYDGAPDAVPSWYPEILTEVLDIATPPGRDGTYTAFEVIGGDDPIASEACVKSHARFGDQATQLWNGGGGSDDPSPGACNPLIDGVSPFASNSHPTHASDYAPPTHTLLGGHYRASARGMARAVWLLPLRDKFNELGVLLSPDPAVDGVPEAFWDTAVLEWEGDLELAGVELAVDDYPGEGIPLGVDDGGLMAVDVNGLGPVYEHGYAGDWGPWHEWPKGNPGATFSPNNLMADGVTAKPAFVLYEESAGGGADGVWTPYDGLDDWSKCFDPAADDGEPDIVLGCWTTSAHDNIFWPTEASVSNPYDVAVKVTFRSPRYRWVWEETLTYSPRPRRVIQRQKDGLVGGGRRVIGGGKTAQNRNRTIGKTW